MFKTTHTKGSIQVTDLYASSVWRDVNISESIRLLFYLTGGPLQVNKTISQERFAFLLLKFWWVQGAFSKAALRLVFCPYHL